MAAFDVAEAQHAAIVEALPQLRTRRVVERFSKIASVTTEAPSACVIKAMYCAWRSVGKPG